MTEKMVEKFDDKNLKRILITIPNQGWLHTSCAHALIDICSDSRYNKEIALPYRMPIEHNRNSIAKDFWEGDYDYWLSFDDDNPPTRNPLDLVELDLDIISLPTPMWKFSKDRIGMRPVWLNAFDYNEKSDQYEEYKNCVGLQEVDGVGTGCILIAKRVFQHPDLQKGAFFRDWNEDGTCRVGGDLMFCKRAKEAGFKIFSHYDYTCHHYKEVSLRDITYGFMEMFKKDKTVYEEKINELQKEVIKLTKDKEAKTKENLIGVS